MTQTPPRRRRRRGRGSGAASVPANTALPQMPPFGGVPIVGVTNGEDLEFAHLTPEGDLHFAASKSQDVIIGPGSMSPQDGQKLIGQTAPSMSISYDIVEDNEFEESLRGPDGLLVYHQMLTDGTVSNALQYLFGAMLSKQWRVIPGTMDPQGYEMAQFVKEQLGLDDTGAGKYAFSRLFTVYKNALVYKQAYGEIVLAQGADGKVLLDKIVPIHPWSVNKIEYDKLGGPNTLVLSGTVKGTGEQVRDKKIPIYKTVTFTHNDDGTFGGESFLRAAVAHWRVKRSLVVLINQSMERFLLGVPVVKVPKAVRAGTAQWAMAQQIARDYILKPRTGVILSPGWEFEVAKLNVNMPDALPYLEYHDAAIARAMGIDFNTIRQSQPGEAPNIGAFVDMTDQTVQTLLREFATAVNLFLIPKLCLLNWPDVRVYPKIAFDTTKEEDFSASANLLGMIINASIEASTTQPTKGAAGALSGGGLNVENIPVVMQTLMNALPPRFKRALGVEELELQEAMSQFQSGASTAYRVDRRKPTSLAAPRQKLPNSA